MQENTHESFEVPGVGELRARTGTSTAELAGAVKYWHDKYESLVDLAVHKPRLEGFIGGVAFTVMFSVCCFGVYYLLR